MTKKANFSNSNSTVDHYDEFFEYYRHWSTDRSAGYHFGVAKEFGDFFNNDKMLENASEMIFEALKLDDSKPLKVLDAGCGAGQVSRLLAKKTSRQVEIYGITTSKKHLELGKKLIAEEQLEDRVLLSQNDFERLPFSADYFDAVFFQDSICHGTGASKYLALQEAARVLKGGGRIALTDGFAFPEKEGPIIGVINKQLCKTFGVECWADEKKFMSALEQNGFADIEEIDLTWKAGPSVAQTMYFKLPKVIFSYLRKKLELKDVAYTFKVATLAPILGLHPYFKYQLVSAWKAN